MPRVRSVVVVVDDRTVEISPDDLQWQFARSAGPGGQHVNRTSSKAVLRFDAAQCTTLPDEVRRRFLAITRQRLTGDGSLLISSQRHREQGRNVAECIEKLVAILEKAMRPPAIRHRTRVPRSSKVARLDAKRRRSTTKRLRRASDD